MIMVTMMNSFLGYLRCEKSSIFMETLLQQVLHIKPIYWKLLIYTASDWHISIIKTLDKIELVLRSHLWLRGLLKLEHTTCQFMSSRFIVPQFSQKVSKVDESLFIGIEDWLGSRLTWTRRMRTTFVSCIGKRREGKVFWSWLFVVNFLH